MDLMRLAFSSIGLTHMRLLLLPLALLIVVVLSACATPIEPRIVEVTRQVTIEVTRSVSERVEVIREVPAEVTREVEATRQIPVEVIKEIAVEVPVEVTRVVPVEVTRLVPVEGIREVPVEVIREVIKEVVVAPTARAQPSRRPTATPRPARRPTPVAAPGRLFIAVPELGFESPVPWKSGERGTGSLRFIYDPLLGTDSQGRLSNSGLAESWKISDDGTEWLFKLREGIPFHHGKELVAGDIVYSIQEWMAKRPTRGFLENLRVLESIDDYTVRIQTSSLDRWLLWDLTDTQLTLTFAIPAAHHRQVGDEGFARDPMGTGPYRHMQHSREERLGLYAPERHWREGVLTIREVRFLTIQDESVKIAGLITGEVDIFSPRYDSVGPIRDYGFKVFLREGWTTVGFRFHQQWDNVPIADVRVRLALNYAIDRDYLADAIFEGWAKPAAVPVWMTGAMEPWTREPHRFDPKRANELLAESGYPDGFEFTIHAYDDRPAPYGDDLHGIDLAELLESGFTHNIGVRASVLTPSYPELREKILNQTIPGDMSYWTSPARPTPGFVRSLSSLFQSTSPLTTTKDPELDDVIGSLNTELDPAKERELMSVLLAITHDRANYLPLLHIDIPYAASDKVPTDWDLGKRPWDPDYLDVVRRR